MEGPSRGLGSFSFSVPFPDNEKYQKQAEHNQQGYVICLSQLGKARLDDLPVASEPKTQEDPDKIPDRTTDERQEGHPYPFELLDASDHCNGWTDAWEEPVEGNKKITIFSEPFLRLEDIRPFKKPKIIIYKKMPPQITSDPEQAQKSQQTPQSGWKIDPEEIQSSNSHEQGPKGGYGIARDRREKIFNKSAQPEKQVDKEIRKSFKII